MINYLEVVISMLKVLLYMLNEQLIVPHYILSIHLQNTLLILNNHNILPSILLLSILVTHHLSI